MRVLIQGIAAVVLVVNLFVQGALADEVVSGTKDVSALFSLTPLGGEGEEHREIGAFDPSNKTVQIYTLAGGSLKAGVRLSVDGGVWAVERVRDGYLVATGQGRGDLNAPIRVWFFSADGKGVRKVFERTSERSQVTQLQRVGGTVWMTFFESKYFTKTGNLSPTPSGEWPFHEVVSTRLGVSVDVSGDRVAIGRPYGDVQGQDGDVVLFEKGAQTLLPSYRGVRSVRFFGKPGDPAIVIGDGWHQNYGQLAQARMSVLQRDPASGRYALQLIRRDSEQYEYGELIPFSLGGNQYIAGIGNKKVEVVSLAKGGGAVTLYSRGSEDQLFDVAYLGQAGSRAWFAVLDQGVHLRSFGVGASS